MLRWGSIPRVVRRGNSVLSSSCYGGGCGGGGVPPHSAPSSGDAPTQRWLQAVALLRYTSVRGLCAEATPYAPPSSVGVTDGNNNNNNNNNNNKLGGASKKRRGAISPKQLMEKKKAGEKITMMTAYDATSAQYCSESQMDCVLVGDSLGNVIQGHSSTRGVTIEDIIYHLQCVTRQSPTSFVIGDMPFGSYEVSDQQAVTNAIRLVKEGGAGGVKLEGDHANAVKAIVAAGIPVVAHIGLQPQTASLQTGSFGASGTSAQDAVILLKQALSLESAGACLLVLECVAAPIAAYITSQLRIPTIGIGAGGGTDGQVLVFHDVLGLNPNFKPRFVQRFAELAPLAVEALNAYRTQVETGEFPTPSHSFRINPQQWTLFNTHILSQSDSGPTHVAALEDAAKWNVVGAVAPSTPTTSVPVSTPTVVEEVVEIKNNITTAIMPLKSSMRATTAKDKGVEAPLKIAVVGGGSLGSLIAATLGQSAEGSNEPTVEVTLVSRWGAHREAIAAHGLRLLSTDGRLLASPRVQTLNYPSANESHLGAKFDVVCVCVKTGDTRVAGESAAVLLREGGVCVTMQNGLGNAQVLRECLVIAAGQRHQHRTFTQGDLTLDDTCEEQMTADRKLTQGEVGGVNTQVATFASTTHKGVCVAQGVTSAGAALHGPGCVRLNGIGRTELAVHSCGGTTDCAGGCECVCGAQHLLWRLSEALVARGLPCELSEDASATLWRKLSVSCGVNPVTALLRLTNGDVAAAEPAARVVALAAAEAAQVARKYGVQIDPDTAAREAVRVARDTGANTSSMLSDILKGLPTEIDAINRAVVIAGKAVGMACPINGALADLVSAAAVTGGRRLPEMTRSNRSAGAAAVNGGCFSNIAENTMKNVEFVAPPSAIRGGSSNDAEGGQHSPITILRSVKDVREWVSQRKAIGDKVGLVPTMGFLHAGHLSLVKTAREQHGCESVIASIFVNPKQFAAHEDLGTYPRDPDGDVAKLQSAGAAAVWIPDTTEMYPPGFATSVNVSGGLTERLCGLSRPHFFGGVATVVLKLLLTVGPDVAVFGEKDYQQLLVVRRMVKDLCVPVHIESGKTMRESDGLAMSSRNARLSASARQVAPILYQALLAARSAHEEGGGAGKIRQAAMAVLVAQEGVEEIDYVDVLCADSLRVLDDEGPITGRVVVALAVKVGGVRLIDNMVLG